MGPAPASGIVALAFDFAPESTSSSSAALTLLLCLSSESSLWSLYSLMQRGIVLALHVPLIDPTTPRSYHT